MDDQIAAARELIQNAGAIAALTGAGISAESGIPTFRGSDGYWQGMSAQELASPQGFAADPRKVWQWYNERRNNLKEIRPNAGHIALAEIEKQAASFGLATQNVDRLHHKAGSRNVLELHGNIWAVRCINCLTEYDRTHVELPDEPKCEKCSAWLRPAVVWFGEMLPAGAVETAERWASECDVFLVIGTSSIVWPAAGLSVTAKDAGAKVIEINPEETAMTDIVDVHLHGKSGDILPRLVVT